MTRHITKGKENHTAYLIHEKKRKKAFEMDCWVGSSLAQVMALMAQPLGVGILGLDKTVAGLVSVGTGPSSGSS